MKLNQLVIAALTFTSAGAMAAVHGTSANTSSPSNQSYTSVQGDSSQVSQIQQALNDKGLNAGPVDGKMGPKTKAALKQFQQSQGLQASGQVDQQTLAALTINGSSASASASSDTSATASGTNGATASGTNGATASGTNGSTASGTNGSTSSQQPGKTPS